jgi:hypothetical protein
MIVRFFVVVVTAALVLSPAAFALAQAPIESGRCVLRIDGHALSG